MSKKPFLKYIASILFLCFIGYATPLWADMDSFKNSIEQAEKTEKKKERDPEKTTESTENNSLVEIIFRLVFLGWGINNLTAIYSDYPYFSEPFIQRDYSTIAPLETKHMLPSPQNKKSWWYTLEVQPFYLQNIGGGSWLTLRGNSWRFFGPYFEVLALTDTKESLGALRLGGTLSIIQTNPFTLSFYGQWISWFKFIERSGGTFGIESRFFLIEPLSFHFRGGFQTFPHFQIGEAEVKSSFFSGPREFYLGWRWWELNDLDQNYINSWSGPFAGIAWWF